MGGGPTGEAGPGRVEQPAAWEAPGPGRWELELSHFGGRFTRLYRGLYATEQRAGTAAGFALYGFPVACLDVRFVNDRPYARVVPLVEPPGRMAGRQPPFVLAWLLIRLHPRFRARAKAAGRVFAEKRWRADVRRWHEDQKPAVVAANLALQEEPVEALDGGALADHLERAMANVRAGVRLHFELVPPDSLPVGDFLAHGEAWGIERREALSLLVGSSAASEEPALLLAPAAAAVGRAPRPPTSLDDVRACGPDAASALDAYMRAYGHRAVASFDLDGATLAELPQLVLASVTALAAGPPRQPEGVAAREAALRGRVPPAERDLFDELLAEARGVYGVRDDNAGPTLLWPVGLLRRALLEAGGRLVEAGRLRRVEDLFEADPDEVAPLVRGGAGPTAGELARRADERLANTALDAPRFLGPDEGEPPLAAIPRPLLRVARAALAMADLLHSAEDRHPLEGDGIGTAVVQGRACVARSPEEALARVEPGDILVAPFTTPAYNAVLPLLDGLVVEEGGPLSHAALVAREFGIAAVIGAAGATTTIPDGAKVEVDPVAGRARLL
jgi:phosphohistidine swiveling domain-containing protein